MKKFWWILITVLILASVAAFGAMAPASAETAAQNDEVRYVDATVYSTYSSETIYYTRRDINYDFTDGGAPLYIAEGVDTNSCGAVAGTEIVAFYDKYYPNLIPGWESYNPNTGKYRPQISEYVTPVMQNLYDLMRINVEGHGVSESEFRIGLNQYFNIQGYLLSYQNVKSGSGLNFDACVAAINSNKVIVLFTTVGELFNFGEFDGYDQIGSFTVSSNHIMIAYGYQETKYYNESGWFRTERFLIVSTGWNAIPISFYKINPTNLESAYALSVS